jgi:hypothetical protein
VPGIYRMDRAGKPRRFACAFAANDIARLFDLGTALVTEESCHIQPSQEIVYILSTGRHLLSAPSAQPPGIISISCRNGYRLNKPWIQVSGFSGGTSSL